MKARAKKARRLLRGQKRLYLIEHWRMADLQRRHAQLEEAQQEIIEALSENQALHGLFIDAAAHRLRSLAKEAESVAREEHLQAKRLLKRAVQVRCAERLSASLEREARRERRQRELMDIIELFARDRNETPA